MTIYKTYPVEIKVVDREAGIYETMISTEDVDRDGDILLAVGCEVDNYLRNPVVLYAHSYRDPPVAKSLSVEKLPGRGIKSRFQFPEWGMSELADTVRRLWDGGFLNAASVGFIPKGRERRTTDDGEPLERGWLFTLWELLEFSIVPVPANQSALRLAYKAMDQGIEDAHFESESKVVVPYRNTGTADEGEAWKAPTLSDFTDETFDELTIPERRRIMAHYVWTANNPPESFGDLKGPHHRAGKTGVGPAIWRGCAALAGRLGQMNVPEGDMSGIRDHLAAHYRQYDKPAPWEQESYEDGDEDDLEMVNVDAETHTDHGTDDATMHDERDAKTDEHFEKDAVETLLNFMTALEGVIK